MHHKNSNSNKSRNGYNLNKDIRNLMLNRLENNEISNYIYEPKYNFPGYDKSQFSPDGEITLSDGSVLIIDNTTSARHDRFKQKQWDAYGVKKHFSIFYPDIKVYYYIVLPDKEHLGSISTRETEYKNFLREKAKFNNENYYSEIDDIIQVSDLIEIITSLNKQNLA